MQVEEGGGGVLAGGLGEDDAAAGVGVEEVGQVVNAVVLVGLVSVWDVVELG